MIKTEVKQELMDMRSLNMSKLVSDFDLCPLTIRTFFFKPAFFVLDQCITRPADLINLNWAFFLGKLVFTLVFLLWTVAGLLATAMSPMLCLQPHHEQ